MIEKGTVFVTACLGVISALRYLEEKGNHFLSVIPNVRTEYGLF